MPDDESWLINEIVATTFRTNDISLMLAFVNDEDLEWFVRKQIFRIVFWEALRNCRWHIADACISVGYPMAPAEFSDGGPLHDTIDVLGDRPDVTQWLIERGAEIERRDHSTGTPLLAAIDHNCDDTVRMLVDHGADVNASTTIDDYVTPLMIAADTGNRKIVELLLASGAQVEASDRWGSTAAEYADRKGHADIASLIRSVNF